MSTDPRTTPLGYRSGPDAAADDVRAMHRSLGTWGILCAVWAIGLCVWVVYLGLIGYLVFRFVA